MAKYIDCEAALRLVQPDDPNDEKALVTIATAKRLVRSIVNRVPAVDAVEVVRCKDCKHYDNSEGIQWCHLNSKFYPGGFDWHCFPEDGFCSYGERRADVHQ